MIRIPNLNIFQRIIVVLVGFFFVLGFILISLWIAIQLKVGDTIYPYTFIDELDMGYKSKEVALQLLKKRNDYYPRAQLHILYRNQPVATFSGELLQLARDADVKVDQAYLIGRSTNLSSRIFQQLNSVFHFKKISFFTGIRYNNDPILSFLRIMEETYNKAPQNALFRFENGKVTNFKAHENGLRIQNELFLAHLDESIQKISEGSTQKTIILLDEIVEPEITLSQANDLGIEEEVGVGVSDYTHSIPTRVHNVILAASKFNGILIPKNGVFSFNEYIGDISSSTGYQPAYVIKNGRTVLGDGGGVCQVSTTMFRAALRSGLPILDRTAHAYRVSYYENDSEPGFDATIFTPSVDLKFKNDTPSALLIQTELDKANNILRFRLYGKKDGRKVEISPVSIWDSTPPPEPKYEDDPTLAQGVVKQIDYAAWGSKSKFSYKVFGPDGQPTIDTSFLSVYRPWQAVFLRGTGQ